MGMRLQFFTCRNCEKPRPLDRRWVESDWCLECVEKTLDQQDREAKDHVQHRQIVEWTPEDE